MPSVLTVILLAIVQGITEFLPISSSGHIVILKQMFGMATPGATFEVTLHLGTMVSVIVYYRNDLAELVGGLLRRRQQSWRYLWLLLLGCVPAAAVGLLFKEQLEGLFSNPRVAMAALLVTGLFLLSLYRLPGGGSSYRSSHAILVGIAQMVALLPGISRSGMTIGAARHLGIEPKEAARFSMFMLIPLVVGAALMELKDITTLCSGSLCVSDLLVGFAVSAVVGYFALALLVRTLSSRHFWCFGIYCVAVGAAGLLLS